MRFSELAASQWLLLLLVQGHSGFFRALGTPRCSWSPKSHCWLLQDQFLILFFRTRLKIVPCPAAGCLNEPWVFFWKQCSLYGWPNSTWYCPAFWHPTSKEFKLLLISTFLPSGPYMLYHGSCHEHYSRFPCTITFHCAKRSRYLASLSVPSV